jgi:hypothetical protein
MSADAVVLYALIVAGWLCLGVALAKVLGAASDLGGGE